MRARWVLAGIAVAGVLLSGCGAGPVTAGAGPAYAAGPVYAADPQLPGSGPRAAVSGSAVSLARSIAARWNGAGAPAPAFSIPVEFRIVDYTATVFNPGSPAGFTAFITTRRTVLVSPASAARIDASNGAPPRFATPADQARWQVAGRPSLGQAARAGDVQVIPIGGFSYLPQGSMRLGFKPYFQRLQPQLGQPRHLEQG